MLHGALGMFDALGFRGIWNRSDTDAQQVLAHMSELQRATEEDANDVVKSAGGPFAEDALLEVEHVVSFLSDTVVIAVTVSVFPDKHRFAPVADGLAVAILGVMTGRLLLAACTQPPRLAYRGCIVVGQYAVGSEKRFLVGPAIDAAAELMNEALGAFVWLAPSALGALRKAEKQGLKFHGNSGPFIDADVPVKPGGSVKTRIVTPFADKNTDERDALIKELLSTFDDPKRPDRLDVAVKRTNTSQVLRASLRRQRALEEVAAWRAKRRAAGKAAPTEASSGPSGPTSASPAEPQHVARAPDDSVQPEAGAAPSTLDEG